MKHVLALFSVLTVLCLISGCAATPQIEVQASPVVINIVECPVPDDPELPQLVDAPNVFIDAPVNIDRLLHRDDVMRQHIRALRSGLTCYELQIPQRE